MSDLDYFAAELDFVTRRLRLAAEEGLRAALRKAVLAAVAPVRLQVRAGLPGHMPSRYATTLAGDLRLTVSNRTTATGASVQLRARSRTGQRRLPRLDDGTLAHPLFGDRSLWFNQTAGVTAGFFSGPARAGADAARAEIRAAMELVALEITGE
jgi:hypothetical protein